MIDNAVSDRTSTRGESLIGGATAAVVLMTKVLALFLASEDSNQITGQIFSINSGLSFPG